MMAVLFSGIAEILCPVQLISSLEGAVGKMGLSDMGFYHFLSDAQAFLASNLGTIACTDCAKGAFMIAKQDFPDLVSHIVQPMQDVCGASVAGMSCVQPCIVLELI
jgi:hypothetical protein